MWNRAMERKMFPLALALLFMFIMPITVYGAELQEQEHSDPEHAVSAENGREEDVDVDKSGDEVVGARLRDPFWPVGYLPPEAVVSGEPVKSAATDEQRKRALDSLRYGGSVRSGGQRYAIVNGRPVQEGDIVTATVEGNVFRFRVHAISMKGVQFTLAD